MSRSLIALIGCLYAAIAVDQARRGQVGMAITYAGYALGNVGLWMLAR